MLFTPAKFTALLLAIVGSVASADASVVSREALAATIVFWSSPRYQGENLTVSAEQGTCINLPTAWQDKPRSLSISNGYKCSFTRYANCAGDSVSYTGAVSSLPTAFDENIHSFLCTKT